MQSSGAQRPISVLIAEDSIGYRGLLIRMIEDFPREFQIVDAVGTAEEVVSAARRHHPSVVLLDLKIPPRGRMLTDKQYKNGLLALACIRQGALARYVIVISNIGDNPHEYVMIERARELGIDGFLSKTDDLDSDTLLYAIRAALAGQGPVCTHKIDPVLTGLGELTPRQRLVFRHLAAGMSNAEIASALTAEQAGERRLSVETVRSHVGEVLDKLGLRSREELLVQPEDRDVIMMSFEHAFQQFQRP